MKKATGFIVLLCTAFCLIGCRAAATTLPPDPEALVFAFAPEDPDDATMLANVTLLKVMIEQRLMMTGYLIEVSFALSTDETTIVAGMGTGDIHVGILSAESYAFATLAHPAVIDVVLASAYEANEAQVDDMRVVTDPDAVMAAVNASGYLGLTRSDIAVGAIHMMLLVRTGDDDAYRSEGIAWLAGKNVALQSSTSRYGFIEPQFMLYQNNLSLVPFTQTPQAAAGEVGYTTITGHANAIIALMNGTVDACFTYLDAREEDAGFSVWQAAHPTLDRFAETRAVALSTGIYGTTVAVRKNLSVGLRNAIRQALLAISYDPFGASALSLLAAQGYVIAHDEAFDGERELYRFRHPERDF
ncbi:MAG: PhnD/SsuA/transferrin family substrate-binding protein [Bacillota bacterium]|nr:PhnD/SsuA/transferrin family substrate-binding protein [Bacillota bacterium]